MKKKQNLQIKLSKGIIALCIVLMISLIGLYYGLKSLKFGLDLQGGFEVLYSVESVDNSKVTTDMVNSTYKIIDKRINSLGVSEPEIAIEGNNIRVTMAGVESIEEARNTISKTANLTFRDIDGNLLMTSDVLNNGQVSVQYNASKGYYISFSIKDYDTFYKKTTEVSKMDNNYLVIWLDYEEETKLEYFNNTYGYYDTITNEDGTKNKIFRACGDLENSNCLSYAGVSQGFASDVIIEGNFEKEEATKLVELINSGSMPTKLTEISSKTVTASFGEDSLYKTFYAGVVGISCIAILLILLYKLSGVIASVSIIAYIFLTITIFNLVGGRLSLQGIAALVIGVGMAVDSAVISFSRIKESLRKKLSLKTSYYEGVKESFVSILDANITTLIAATILFIFGESSVKGFATMLIISIIVTFIIMIYLNRYIMSLFARNNKIQNHSNLFIGYKDSKHTFNFDFVKHKTKILLFVGIILASGCMYIYSDSLNLGIDFKGGSTITINSNEKLKEKDIKKDIKELELNINKIDVISENTLYVTISDVLDNKSTSDIEEYFNDKYAATTSVGSISNEVKKNITFNAIKALIYACIGMILYISIRFKFNYGISAILALIHDSLMVIIVFALLRLEINSMFIAAILSIVGYSINNTIIIFDRIRENKTKLYKDKIKSKEDLKSIVNISLRQTISRCLITTITTLLPIISLIFIGSYEIINFNIALLVGLIVGTFSSIFISSQIWMLLEIKSIGKNPNKHWYDDSKKEKEELQVKGINC